MQKFQSHKIVEAFKIHEAKSTDGQVWKLTGTNGEEASVDQAWIEKRVPGDTPNEKLAALINGYFVRYPGTDAYTSYSPAEAFEKGYTALPKEGDAMYALHAMQSGQKVARHGWNGKGQFLQLQVPDANSKMTLPYIFITTVDGHRVPWVASQTDMLANDWYVVEE